jgi:hypothetical protein
MLISPRPIVQNLILLKTTQFSARHPLYEETGGKDLSLSQSKRSNACANS